MKNEKEIAKIFTPFLRTAYNYDTNKAGDESGLSCPEPTMAQQQFKDETDINTIVKRFGITGELPTNVRMPTYQDYEEIYDYHSAMNATRLATESFNKMPAEIRARFGNDPGLFVDFCANEGNRVEAEKLGLVPAQVLEAKGKEEQKTDTPPKTA
ncbi:MAG: internal scaffolding protein [Microvirus sp.]|nr:MAG: internal scaffolding protein [Microvirus sp.]